MKLYTGKTPMALRVNVAVAEKGIDIPTEWLDVMGGATRSPEHLTRNSLGEIPVLELDDDSCLTESIAICRYLDSLHSQVPLFGETALETARIEMWTRRMEQQFVAPLSEYVLHTMPFFAQKIEQIPAYAESQQLMRDRRWGWLENELADGRTYVAGDHFSIADIAGMSALLINDFIESEIPASLPNIKRWEAAMRNRKGW